LAAAARLGLRYHRAASLSSQAFLVDAWSMGWKITDPGICSSTESTWIQASSTYLWSHIFLIQHFLSNDYISLLSAFCAFIQVKKMALQMKPQFLSGWILETSKLWH